MSATSASALTKFTQQFNLQRPEEVAHFFPQGRFSGPIGLLRRLKHRKVSETAVCLFAAQHPSAQVSQLFAHHPLQRKIQRAEQGIFIENPSLLRSISNSARFLRAYFSKDGKKIGALFPCSRFAAREIAKHIPTKISDKQELNVLEIGAGSNGPLTKEIFERMPLVKKGSKEKKGRVTIDINELRPDFCKELRKRFGHIFNNNRFDVNLIQGDILDHTPSYKYDRVICSLPFNSLPESVVNKIFSKIQTLAKPNAIVSMLDYGIFSQAKTIFAPQKTRASLKRILLQKDTFFKEAQKREQVFPVLNIPPVRVRHMQLA